MISKHWTIAAALLVALPAAIAAKDSTKPKESAVAQDPNVAVVMEMIAAWDARDGDKIADMFTEDGVLHSMMIAPIKGREAIRPRMKFLVDNASHMKITPRTIAVTGNTVFLERTDSFTFKGHKGSVPVVGVLEIRDGKVAEWREYYDRKELLEAMGVKGDF
ncbi:SgcJ/EcaC family oxidoreductase [Glacieibacterium frigidum]|uniref:Nuclear transport factor 2 family protein n=1 Tax=Glacieibacterium frigidum TaxID=2593303 RepID=A0A552U767_9SPHN|nr:nuclear transport factor 2 family protein [Glacieibacterium frigidum]TRW14060.1 nuclear transport factor 2 family protein [Glacieibacterium frigidum]